MASDSAGTGFAPFPPDEGAATGSGKKGAPDPAISSACEVPPYAAPVCLCLRFMPHRRGTHFSVHILDLATGHVLDEQPSRAIAELPAALAETTRWVFCR